MLKAFHIIVFLGILLPCSGTPVPERLYLQDSPFELECADDAHHSYAMLPDHEEIYCETEPEQPLPLFPPPESAVFIIFSRQYPAFLRTGESALSAQQTHRDGRAPPAT